MEGDPPIIELGSFRRLGAVEQKLGRSPAAVACTLAAVVGLLVAVIGGAQLFEFVAVPGWEGERVGVVIAFAGFLFCTAAVGLGRAWQLRRLSRLRCPHCGGALSRHVADLGEEEQGRWGEKGVCLDGRWYCAPFVGEGDKRRWVRAMKEVWACVSCRVYVDGDAPHERTCTDDELKRLREHSAQG